MSRHAHGMSDMQDYTQDKLRMNPSEPALKLSVIILTRCKTVAPVLQPLGLFQSHQARFKTVRPTLNPSDSFKTIQILSWSPAYVHSNDAYTCFGGERNSVCYKVCVQTFEMHWVSFHSAPLPSPSPFPSTSSLSCPLCRLGSFQLPLILPSFNMHAVVPVIQCTLNTVGQPQLCHATLCILREVT